MIRHDWYYSRSTIEPQTHCVTIYFTSGINVDVVPVIYEGDSQDYGYLIAKDTGDRVLTSIPLHLEFIRERKRRHGDAYRQIVRFMKWWARRRKIEDSKFRCKSFMIELLCAYLADIGMLTLSDYALALEQVFGYIVRTGLEDRISFGDYYGSEQLPEATGAAIEIFDPVNPLNNVAVQYGVAERDAIVEAAFDALDALTEAHPATTKERAVERWQIVFGPHFRG